MIGRLLDGRYRVRREIGRGGMGEVYLARDEAEGRDVALKVMPPDSVEDARLKRRFRREILACSRLDHPNVVHYFGLGFLEDGRTYFTMEYLPCATLASLVERAGALGEERTLRILEQVTDALAHVHSLGLVHRDVKPSNVLLKDGGHAVLTDFGLVMDAHVTRMTRTGEVMGTPRYLSPDRCRARTTARYSWRNPISLKLLPARGESAPTTTSK